MITQTVERFAGLVPVERIFVVTSESLADAIAEAVPQLPAENILLEPAPRNTAPCIGMACVAIRERLGSSEEVVAVFPVDHFIRDLAGFQAAVQRAATEAESGAIVMLGVEPTVPETGYGYIHTGEELSPGVRAVENFVEKPNRAQALEYLTDGNYLWNSGMFCFRIDAMLGEMERQMPTLAAQLESMAPAIREGDPQALSATFEEIESESIDYGIMEGAERVRVVPVCFGWSDVGHWDALPSVAETDDAGNVTMGDVVAVDCRDSVLIGHDERVLAAVGLDHVVVVDTEDAMLVASRDRVQEVRAIVAALTKRDSKLV